MKKLPSLVLLFIVTTVTFAQKEANHWMFGEGLGLSFDTNNPRPVASNIQSITACASISNPQSGELLFYSNGETVWNREHEVMQNGVGLRGELSTNQGVLITPFPGESDLYYLFTLSATVKEDSTSAQLYYSVVDMSLDNGLGAVLEQTKNTFITNRLTEKMTAIRHANGQDFWLIVHEMWNNNFLVYHIGPGRVNLHRRVAIGSIHPIDTMDINMGSGYLKASPNGKKLAQTQYSGSMGVPLELFDFDSTTGTISNPLSLGNFLTQHGMSFSPDNTKLYVNGTCTNCPGPPDIFYQFDLEQNDIAASRIGLIFNNPRFDFNPLDNSWAAIALQNAPDGKIYTTGSSGNLRDPQLVTSDLLVINNPNAHGYDSDIRLVSFNFRSGMVRNGLPNFIESTFNNLSPTNNPNAPCSDEIGIDLYPNPTGDYITLEVAERCFSEYTLSFYNTIGQFMGQHLVDRQEFGPIEVKSFKSGLYFAVLEFADGRIVKRFIKL
ncbi:MAG: T9SS type A sorting domain-containing protein [Cytophagales bacterium]|nr:T9SS type A sorting domain-containing protein [Cytophagales bacterium]